MQAGSLQRFCPLLLVLTLWLSLATTGCSDRDREDGYKPQPAADKAFTYVYEKAAESVSAQALGKVPASAVYIQATAVDAGGNVIPNGATLATCVVAEQRHAQDGKYYAYTTVTDNVEKVIYVFYYTTDTGVKIGSCIWTLPGVAALADDAMVTEKDAVLSEISAKCYTGTGQEQCTFLVGETFQVKVFDRTEEITAKVGLTGYDKAIVERREGTSAFVFSALGAGKSYFDVEYLGVVIPKAGLAVIANAPVPTLSKLLLCPNGYSVAEGQLYDNQGTVVTDYSNLPTRIGELSQGEKYTFFAAGLYSNQAVVALKAEEVSLTASNAQATVKGLEVTVKDDASGDEVITAHTNDGQLASNKISFKVAAAPAPELNQLLLCPQGYSVRDNKLYDDSGFVITNYAALPALIDDLLQGADYTFFVAGVYTDASVREMAVDAVNLTPSAGLVTVAGFTVTATNEETGIEHVSAKYAETGQSSNVISFNVVAPTLEQLLLCPQGYSVKNGSLYDDNAKMVTNYDSLPTSIAEMSQGDDYTFFVAGVYSNNSVSAMLSEAVTLTASANLVEVEGFTITVKGEDTGKESITAKHTESGQESKAVHFNVVAPTLERLLLCPQGYSVKNGSLYDDKAQIVLNYDSLPTSIAEMSQGDDYTFFVAGVYSNNSISAMLPEAVTLTPSANLVEVEGFIITVKGEGTGKESITAKHTESGKESKAIHFTVVAPTLERLLLCPHGYSVKNGCLYDDNDQAVLDYDNLPASIADLNQGDKYTFFVAGLYSNSTVLAMTPEEVTLSANNAQATIERFEITVKSNASGTEVITASTQDSDLDSNQVSFKVAEVPPPSLVRLLLCPYGYSVKSGNLYDENNQLVLNYDKVPTRIADIMQGAEYTFLIAGVYSDAGVRLMAVEDVVLCSACDMVTIHDFTITAKSDVTGSELLYAKHSESEMLSNDMNFDVVEPVLTQLLLCPNGYRVANGALYDDKGDIVTNYTSLPTDIDDLSQGQTYTFFVAGVYSDELVRALSEEEVTLRAVAGLVTVKGLTVTAKHGSTAAECVSVSHPQLKHSSNAIFFYVVEPQLSRMLLCPNGYQVTNGKLYNAVGDEVTNYDALPTTIGTLYPGESYTFFAASVYSDAKVHKEEVPDVQLSDSGGRLTISGLKVTALEGETGVDSVSVVHNSAQIESNAVEVAVVAPLLSRVLLCSHDYHVEDGKLYKGFQIVTDYDSLPTTLTLPVLNEETLCVAGVYTDGKVRALSSNAAELDMDSKQDVLYSQGFTVASLQVNVGTVPVWAQTTEDKQKSNILNVNVTNIFLTQVLLCPSEYRVVDGQLYHGNIPIEDYSSLPTQLEMRTHSETAFCVAGVFTDGLVRPMGTIITDLLAPDHYWLLDIEGHTIRTSDQQGTAQVYAKQNLYAGKLKSNEITVTVRD